MECKSCYCQIFIKLEFPQQIFEEYSYITFRKNLTSGSRVVPSRRKDCKTGIRTDRRAEVNCVSFCSYAQEPKNTIVTRTTAHGC